MKLIFKKYFLEKKILVKSPYYTKEREKKKGEKGNIPQFSPQPPHPTQLKK